MASQQQNLWVSLLLPVEEMDSSDGRVVPARARQNR
jgi:hypothetical protein